MLFVITLVFFLGIFKIYSFENSNDTINVLNSVNNNDNSANIDTINKAIYQIDKYKDTLKIKKKSSGLDSAVVYSAKDSVEFIVEARTLRLRGSAIINFKTQKLEAENIILNISNSTLEAHGGRDTSGKIFGYPLFHDNTETYYGEKVLFNFKSQQGVISLGETTLGDGFYFGSKIKRVSENEFFIKDGCYTTCNSPHPHYYFGSPEMKVVAQDRVFLDPLIFYVEDMPIFILPIGLFFPNKSGRQSGLVIPSFFFSKNRGVTFENIGIYLALSEYYDTQFLMDFYSKGGYNLKNQTRWALTDAFTGSLDFQYGKTRFSPDDDYTTNWSLGLNHDQSLTPQSRITANMRLMSQNFTKNTSSNLQDRMQGSVTSNASYWRNFDNGQSMSISYGRNQNIITDEYNQNSRLAYSIPQLFPLKALFNSTNSLPSWLNDLAFTYSIGVNWEENKARQIKSTVISADSTSIDTSYVISIKRKISHSPSISVSPKLGYFTLTPSFSFSANNYFRRIKRSVNPVDSTINEVSDEGFFTEYSYNIGVNLSTRVFGIIKPKIFGINALRHTFQPNVGFSYTPDLSDPSLGFYDSYYDLKNSRNATYSRFELDGGGIASRARSQSLNYSFLNSFEAKIAQGDTAQDKNIELLRWTVGGSYNFVADSLRFSDISMTFRTPSIGNLSFNCSSAFTLYDEAKAIDPKTGKELDYYIRINKFLSGEGKGLMRLTSLNLQVSTSISSQGMSAASSFSQDTKIKKTSTEDSISIGERFRQRIEASQDVRDFFGENSPGWSGFSIPWNLSLGLSFQYSRPTLNNTTRSINLNTSFSTSFTQTWSIEARTDYDLVNNEILAPSINIKKTLHCWQLDFQWYPIGYSRGFYLKFGINASMLQDLKLERRSSPLLR